ncbi:alpha-L-rhamnosidase C-terminal domain-containing protein [Streptomyces sp. NPDC094149]|uniref:alpha-L-rhamnosidase C-terminal domain-containing protein n=1 Tax=Streptomyces sp. NPDC094149 TaxID=3155079 RepID=UPI0033194B03
MGGDRGRGGGARPGWGTVAPCPGGGLTSASARHDSPHGTIAGHSRLTDDDLALTVGIPPRNRGRDPPSGSRADTRGTRHLHVRNSGATGPGSSIGSSSGVPRGAPPTAGIRHRGSVTQ